MKLRKVGEQAIATIALTILSLLGLKTAIAATHSESIDRGDLRLSQQNCPDPEYYARVITETDPLSVRSTPNGSTIGAIPKGWAIVTNGKDSTGEWTHVTSHFGDIGSYGFADAPNFRQGWVSTRFLRPLGRYCYKPTALLKIPSLLFGGSSVVVHEDWNQRGDRLSRQIK
ncbi:MULTISPECIES: hypothetical protein [Spirulina sp. CCY15215]|uniref:hypothetical protein n=1 Tax=Spirulina sp. CCY15215 TaxID=2767591 RepID=UPI0019500E3A|nr:hypothetical protein [Spirulina major]